MLKMWKKIFDEGGYISAIFMDLPKTFAKCNYYFLIAKLGTYGFKIGALRYMKSYLMYRKQRIRVNKILWVTVDNNSIYGRPFLLPDNGSRNSIFNLVLKLNLVQQIFFNPNTPNNVSFYCLTKHWILHIACISPASWFKMFALFKFRDYTKLNVVGERNWMEIGTYSAPRPPAAFSRFRSFLLNSNLF